MDCYNCEFHATIVATHHISCKHPAISSLWNSKISEILAIIGGPLTLIPTIIADNKEYKVVELSEHGVKHGWAAWPYNFDPIWVDVCILKDLVRIETKEEPNT